VGILILEKAVESQLFLGGIAIVFLVGSYPRLPPD
jgi:hypothetical protein